MVGASIKKSLNIFVDYIYKKGLDGEWQCACPIYRTPGA